MEQFIGFLPYFIIVCLIVALSHQRLSHRIKKVEGQQMEDKLLLDSLNSNSQERDAYLRRLVEDSVKTGMKPVEARLDIQDRLIEEVHDMVSSLVDSDNGEVSENSGKRAETRDD